MVDVSPSATRLDDFVLNDAIFDLLNLTGAAQRLCITSCLVNSFSKSSQILSIADVAQNDARVASVPQCWTFQDTCSDSD